jgi:hypothetical protein
MSTTASINLQYSDGTTSGSVTIVCSHDGYPESIVDGLLADLAETYRKEGLAALLDNIISDLDTADGPHFATLEYNYDATLTPDEQSVSWEARDYESESGTKTREL